MHDYTQETEAEEIYILRIQGLFAVVRKWCMVLDMPSKIWAGGICVFLKSSPYFFWTILQVTLAQNLRSRFLRWLWNAPGAQHDSLDKAAEGEMQKDIPLIGMDKKSPSDGQLPGRASLPCFYLPTPAEKRLIPAESYLRIKLMVTGEPSPSNPVRLIPPAPHPRLKFH